MEDNMKKWIWIIITLFTAYTAFGMDVKGDFNWETRVSLTNGDFLFNQLNGKLKFEHQANDNLYGTAQLGFRFYNNPLGQTSLNSTLSAWEMGNLYSVQPLEISLDQAYFTYKDFLFDGLDISAGKQRITWGTADKLNPTDLLNANDFSDPLDYGRKIPTASVNLTYNFPVMNSGIQFVYEPLSPVARLNSLFETKTRSGIVSNAAKSFYRLNAASTVWSGTVITPSPSISNFTIGTKLFGTLAGFDLSAGYLTRLNDLPEATKIAIDQNLYYNNILEVMNSPSSATVTLNNAAYTMEYYREHVITFDFSKDLDFILLWGEASVVFQPESKTRSVATNHIYTNGVLLMTQVATTDVVALSNEVDVKYTVGFDKTFGDGWYVNFQYNHGFFNERGNNGAERLQDYLALRFEKKFFGDKLKFSLTGIYNVNNFFDAFSTNDVFAYLNNHYGVMGSFSVTFLPADDVSLEIGVEGFDGKDDTSIGAMRNYDMAYMKFGYLF